VRRLRGFTNDEGAMRTAAAKAIELDPDSAEAHGAMAIIGYADWDWARAEQELRRAMMLNPDGFNPLASLLSMQGRHAEAIAAAEHAAKLDPLTPNTQATLGVVRYFARRYEGALVATKRALELEPRSFAAMIVLGMVYEALGRPQDMLAVFDRPEFQDTPYKAWAYARLGRRDEALKVLNRLAMQGNAIDLQAMAIAYFVLGDKDRGFEWLTKAIDRRSGYVPFANVQPAFDGVRSDPRFKALVARLNLPHRP